MGWLLAASLITLALLVPLRIRAVYDESGGRACLNAGPVCFSVYPAKKDRSISNEEKPEKKNKADASHGSSIKNGGSISDFYPFITLILDFLSDFRRKLRVDLFQLHIILAGGDPADLAQNYGKAWGAVGVLWPKLERFLVVKNRDVKIQCDFEGWNTSVCARIDVSLTLGRLLSMVLRHGTSLLKEFFRFRKKRYGGIV